MTCARCGRDEPIWAASLIDSADHSISHCQCQSRSLRHKSGPYKIDPFAAGNSWPRRIRTEATTITDTLFYPWISDHSQSCDDLLRLMGRRTISTSGSLGVQENVRKTSREIKKETLVKKRLVSDSGSVSPTKHVRSTNGIRGSYHGEDYLSASDSSAPFRIPSSLNAHAEETPEVGSQIVSPRPRQLAKARLTSKLVVRKRDTGPNVAPTTETNGSDKQTLDEAFSGLRLDEVDRKHAQVTSRRVPATCVVLTSMDESPKPGPLPPTSDFDPILRSAEKKHWPREWFATDPFALRSRNPRVSRSPSPSICAMMIPPSPTMYSRKSSSGQEDFNLP